MLRIVFISLQIAVAVFLLTMSFSAAQTARDWERERQAAREQAAQNLAILKNADEIASVEEQLKELKAYNLDARVIRLEAISETNHELLIGLATGTGLLLFEALFRLLGVLKVKKEIGHP